MKKKRKIMGTSIEEIERELADSNFATPVAKLLEESNEK